MTSMTSKSLKNNSDIFLKIEKSVFYCLFTSRLNFQESVTFSSGETFLSGRLNLPFDRCNKKINESKIPHIIVIFVL